MSDPISAEERGLIAIARMNKLEKTLEVKKTWKLGRLSITYNWRSKKNLWGRFGGGWNWIVGVEIGSTTTIVNLLVFSLRFYVKPREAHK